ncbi:tribbles homolog 2-like [Oppia nitens]|uniref:tribbles homolog 2-like n=1 Tax=Oppia nitens TaxID=1686743 RepID=UPI0023DB43C9|nr:tribbles homolog 2-like [Oppia nitens]
MNMTSTSRSSSSSLSSSSSSPSTTTTTTTTANNLCISSSSMTSTTTTTIATNATRLTPLDITKAKQSAVAVVAANGDHQPSSIDDQKSWSTTITTSTSTSTSTLNHNLQPPSPSILVIYSSNTNSNNNSTVRLPSIFGNKYLVVSQFETSNLYRCFDINTNQEFCCKIIATNNYHEFLMGHLRMDGHTAINQVEEVLVGKLNTFVVFGPAFGDLHSYVRSLKRLRESEAVHIFHQIVTIVSDCHRNGIILRDLKLRKFLFANKERNQIKLETLEDAAVLDDCDDDMISDKHGCPAYVSPEILSVNRGAYSAKQADCWSLGVILYTMLVGRYPFHDVNPSLLFSKIRRGTYVLPDSLSSAAKCLIRSLLRLEPNERLTAEDILSHRWFRSYRSNHHYRHSKTSNSSSSSSMSSAFNQNITGFPNSVMSSSSSSSLSSSSSDSSSRRHQHQLNSVSSYVYNNSSDDQTVPDLIDDNHTADANY